MLNIKFPETDIVTCIFSYRTTNNSYAQSYDEFDRVESTVRMKRYYYRVPEILKGQLSIGDVVLVHCQTGYQLCEIAEVNASIPRGYDFDELAPVVCKVDLSNYIAEVKKQKELVRMRDVIEREKKRLESMVTYEILAEKDPSFAALLKAYKDAGGSF